MSELIKRQDAIDAVAKLYRYESDRMTALQEVPVITEQEIRNKVIDEFAELLKSDEFQKYNLDMVFETSRDLSYSHCINAFCEYIDEIAEQMKGGE